jgi:phosphoglycolate phosphatase-like HAD superfamily hydrolase
LKAALDAEGIELSVWCIHRKIGMSGGLFTNQLLREIEVEIDPERIELLRRGHAEAYQRHASEIRPLPGARKPLVWLIQAAIPWAIATSSRKTAAVNLAALTRDQVRYAKPDPDLFLAAAEQLDAPIERQSSSATVSGTCSRPHAAGRWATDCSAAATVQRNCGRRGPFAFTRTRPTF